MTFGTLISLTVGAALVAALAQFTIPVAAWVALPLLLHASRSMSAGTSAVAIWTALAAAYLIGNRGIMPMSGPAYILPNVMLATTLTVVFVVDRFASVRLTGVTATLVFPVVLVAVEFLRSRFGPAASWISLAYTQYGNLALMQVAAVAGIWGITFLLGWTASTIELVWIRQGDWRAAATPVLVWGSVMAIALIAGGVRLALAPTDRASMRVATINRPRDLFVPGEMTQIASGRVAPAERPQFADKLARLHDWFLERSRREARAGAQLIAWPEQNLLVFADDEPAFLARARELAIDEHVYLAMGLGTIYLGEPLPLENKLVLIDPSGETLVAYRKTHPVVGWEASIMRRGDGRVPVVETPDGRMAGAICYDADFPEFIRQAGLGAADLLIVPANEWREIKEVHAHMAAFRAIENGVTLVRPAASGLSTVVDPWGRILGISDYFAGDSTMTAQVSAVRVPTLYARIGDLFAWMCVMATVVMIVLAIRQA
jgi:apolipoprotein N-acyltransferase